MHGITAKSLITGLILATVTGALVPFIGLYMQGSNSGAYFTSQIAHVFLLLLIILALTLLTLRGSARLVHYEGLR